MAATRPSATLLTALLSAVSLALSGCGAGASKELVIPHSAIEALANYAFTSDLHMTWTAQGQTLSQDAQFAGTSQRPDRVHGMLTAKGSFWSDPSPAEVTVIGIQAWWRRPGGAWQGGAESTQAGILPAFANLATPRFYIEGLSFDTLRLAADGSETLDGTDTYRIRLNKSQLVSMLDHGTFVKEEGKNPAIVREDAMAFLPDDTKIDVWLAKDDLHPVRLIVSLRASADDQHAQDFFLGKPFDIRLQMDITDPQAQGDILPPQ